MYALVTTVCGSPDVLALRQVALHTPKEDELLIRVHAGPVSPAASAGESAVPARAQQTMNALSYNS